MTAGCEFTDGAKGGLCTGTPGVLSAAEINKIIKDGAKVTFDKTAAVKIATWNSNQWVSWDDTETLKMKIDYANQRCLGGYVCWITIFFFFFLNFREIEFFYFFLEKS